MKALTKIPLSVCRANYANPLHARALIDLLDAYAQGPMGGGEPLSDFAKTNLVASLSDRPQAFSVLAFTEKEEIGEPSNKAAWVPIGLVNCIEGFSTFACQPLVNIHDVAVLSEYRGQRVAEQMMTLVEEIARDRGACKLTLEVLQGNAGAIKLYHRVGFANYQLDPAMGQAQFLQKWLR